MNYEQAHNTLNRLKATILADLNEIESARIRTTGPGFYTLKIKTKFAGYWWLELSVNGFDHSTGYRTEYASKIGKSTNTPVDSEIIKHFKTLLKQYA